MVEITKKYKIGSRRFGLINWVGAWTLYKKEVLRFLIVWIQTIFSPHSDTRRANCPSTAGWLLPPGS